MTILGGINIAIPAALIIRPMIWESLYPCSKARLRIGCPIAAMVAWDEPDTEPKSVLVATATIPVPPLFSLILKLLILGLVRLYATVLLAYLLRC